MNGSVLFVYFLAYACVHVALEMVYAFIMVPKYEAMVNKMGLQNGINPTIAGWVWAALGYSIYLLGTFYFVIYPILTGVIGSLGASILHGVAYGIVIYGVFNFTNMYLFGKGGYQLGIAVVDLTYGALSVGVLSGLAWLVGRRVQKGV